MNRKGFGMSSQHIAASANARIDENSPATYEFSMHESMSTSDSEDDTTNDRNHTDNTADDNDGDASNRRVVMMYDEDGNAKPMLMAQFYYDSVNQNIESNKNSDNSDCERANNNRENPTSAPTPGQPARSDASARGMLKLQNRGRGVALSSSSSEDDAPGQPRYDSSAKHTTNENGDLVVDDSALDDKLNDQFMRIEVTASELKDVSEVKKDVNHDRQKAGHGLRVMSGLQRVLSNKKNSDAERLRPIPVGGTRGIQRKNSGLQQSSSQTRSVNPMFAKSREGDTQRGEGYSFPERQRDSDAGKGGKRLGLSAIGRVMSMNRNKTLGTTISNPQKKKSDGVASMSETSSVSNSNTSLGQHLVEGRGEEMVTTERKTPGHESLSQRSTTSASSDRPRNSDRVIPGTASHRRAGIGQVGRLLSRNRRKSVMLSSEGSTPKDDDGRSVEDRAVGTNGGPVGPRASLSRLGRMISMKKSKSVASTVDGSGGAVVTNAGKDSAGGKGENRGMDGNKVSPISTSTVSSGSMGELAVGDRDRKNGNVGGIGARRERRLNLRGAGRMFSLTRKSGMLNTSSGIASGESAPERKTSVRSEMAGDGRGSVSKGKKEGVTSGSSKSEKFVYSEVTSEVIAQSGVLGGAKQIRVAVIAMAEFSDPLSRDKWYLDGFTLPHNAVRRECMDLYDILSALARCDKKNDLCDDDIAKLEAWWDVAKGFFRCYFDVERRVLFPWVDSAGAQEWEVQLALKKMRSLKDKLETLLAKVERVWNEKTFKTCAEMYGLVYKAVDEFVPRLMNYFVDQEVLLPAIVKELYSKEQRGQIDKQMVGAFMEPASYDESGESRHNLILLVRWMSKPRQLRAWLGKNLSNSARAMYPGWFEMFNEQHGKLLLDLKSRATTTVDADA